MPNPDQLDIKEIRPGIYRLEFSYNENFISFLKNRVPARDRSYDPETKSWEIRGEQYLAPIEGVGVQHFPYAMRYFYRGSQFVMHNLKTHQESVQETLF